MIVQEVTNKEGVGNWMIKAFTNLDEMSAFSYIIEVWCTHRIMKRRNLDHKQYAKIQQEIEHVVNIGRRAWNLLRKTRHIFKFQSKVVKLLDIDHFKDEHNKLPALYVLTTRFPLISDKRKLSKSCGWAIFASATTIPNMCWISKAI